MLIVLDGSEHAGKTTLANYLVQHHNAVYFHRGYRFRDKIFTYHASALRKAFELSATRLVVIDRLWMSESVYGQVYRGGTKWPYQGRMFDRILRRMGALQVVCVTDPAHASSVIETHPGRDLYQDQAKAAEVATHFLGLVDRQITLPLSQLDERSYRPKDGNYFFELQHFNSRPDILHYDYRHWAVADAAKWVLSRLAENRASINPICFDATLMNLAGRLDKSPGLTLMVGDRCNPRSPKVAWPFFGYHGSSLFLAEALSRAGICEDRLVWTNSGDPGFSRVLESAIQAGVTRFVAMGRNAEKALVAAGIRDPKFVFHPAAVARWRNLSDGGVGEYAHDLAEVIDDANFDDDFS